MTYILTIVFFFLYTFGLFLWDKKVTWRLSPKISKTIKYFHYAGLSILLFVTIMYSLFDIGLRGQLATRVIEIFTLLTGCTFILISSKTINNWVEKIYFNIFSFLPTIIGSIMCIPFLGVVIIISIYGHLFTPNFVYYQDNKIRVESSVNSPLAIPNTDIYRKYFLFEKRIYRGAYLGHVDTVIVLYDNDSTRLIAKTNTQYDDSIKRITLSTIK